MSALSEAGRQQIEAIAARYGLSFGAVEAMARSVNAGGGTMAQFNIPELGGSGQWMAGGMTMVGDMFNSGLQSTVSNLCTELSNAMMQTVFFEAPRAASGQGFAQNWWPAELGSPSSSGGQNQMRYAYFPSTHRVAVDLGNGSPIIVLDTLDHQIGGFGQQQQGGSDPFYGVSFSSQYGQFALSSLPRIAVPPASDHVASRRAHGETAASSAEIGIDQPGIEGPSTSSLAAPQPQAIKPIASSSAPVSQPGPKVPSAQMKPEADHGQDPQSILDALERLGALHQSGILTQEEFETKKAELLARL
ncbi:MAG: SHOCT domain-containing protein [Neomegalonema sp.]|nr:SHOCT domain-containing protein [Neomegalonema sp.]